MLQPIDITVISHEDQRYPTVGDWFVGSDDGALKIKISNLNNEDYEFLIAIHELVEAFLCAKHGIAEAEVTAFDKQYEAERQPNDYTEPGDSPFSPYRKEHKFATFIEQQIAYALDVNWTQYSEAMEKL